MTSRVLITGAGGFVGRRLVSDLAQAGLEVVPVYRAARDTSGDEPEQTVRLDIDNSTNWRPHLKGVDAVVHLAGLAHSTSELYGLDQYREVNVEGTKNLAMHAAESGVRRLVFLSSIKVNGDFTTDRAFRIDDRPDPVGAYAVSKSEAEVSLREIESVTNLEVVIIRPPLVYGPGLKGNLASLLQLIDRGVPVPTGGIKNERDLISIYNLCDLIRVCITHPKAASHTFLASDGDSVSTNELIQHLASGIGKNARIWPLPTSILRFIASIAGRSEQLKKLSSSLQIDMGDTLDTLDWQPPYTMSESFEKAFADNGA